LDGEGEGKREVYGEFEAEIISNSDNNLNTTEILSRQPHQTAARERRREAFWHKRKVQELTPGGFLLTSIRISALFVFGMEGKPRGKNLAGKGGGKGGRKLISKLMSSGGARS